MGIIWHFNKLDGCIVTMNRRRAKRLKRKGLIVTVPNIFYLYSSSFYWGREWNASLEIYVDMERFAAIKQLEMNIYMSSGVLYMSKLYPDFLMPYAGDRSYTRVAPAILVFKTKREAIIGKMLAP